jgi:protein-tyrosine phosphatase
VSDLSAAPGPDRPTSPAIHASVDLHCHILPGIDDGARDLADAVAMGCEAQADGIEAICATPHIRHDHDVRIPELAQRRAALGEALAAAGCRTPILRGGEVASSAVAGLDAAELRAVALGDGGRWILLEPVPGPLDDRLDAAVADLSAHGYRALIAHPERHLTADLVARLSALVDRGCLIQATAAYLLDPATRDGMLALARAGVLHVLASDAHSARSGRPVATAAALSALGDVTPTAEHLEWIARTAPRAIVAGAAVTPPFAPLTR